MDTLKTKIVTKTGIGWSSDMTPEKFKSLVRKRTRDTGLVPIKQKANPANWIDRKCSLCFEWLPIAEFYPAKTGKQKLHVYCKSCCSIKARAQTYGLTIPQVKDMIVAAGGRCKLCTRQSDSLVVDHCHSTGKVRGLICPLCNVAMAAVDKIPNFLTLALKYSSPMA